MRSRNSHVVPRAAIHDLADEIFVHEGDGRRHRQETEAERGDFVPVKLRGGDLHAMAAAAQLQPQRERRVQVAERAEGGEEDAGHGEEKAERLKD